MEVFITLADFDGFKQEGAGGKSKKKKKRRSGGGSGGKGGARKGFSRSHVIYNTPAVRSNFWAKLIFASLCVIPRSREFRIYVGACYTRGARSRRSRG